MVADTGNHAVRRVDLATGQVVTLAGTAAGRVLRNHDESAVGTPGSSP